MPYYRNKYSIRGPIPKSKRVQGTLCWWLIVDDLSKPGRGHYLNPFYWVFSIEIKVSIKGCSDNLDSHWVHFNRDSNFAFARTEPNSISRLTRALKTSGQVKPQSKNVNLKLSRPSHSTRLPSSNFCNAIKNIFIKREPIKLLWVTSIVDLLMAWIVWISWRLIRWQIS